MIYIPHEKLNLNWTDNKKSFLLDLPWISMEIEVDEANRPWIEDAIDNVFASTPHDNVQRFLRELHEYPVSYIKPRPMEEFDLDALQSCSPLDVDTATPRTFLSHFEASFEELEDSLPSSWTWDWEKILAKSQVPGSDLYDPLSFMSYLFCYRQDWESDSWSGEDHFNQFLENLRETDEESFFQAIGWVVKQSYYVTSEACKAMETALIHFDKAHDFVKAYITEEVGHHKFMEQVFQDLDFDKNDFPVGSATKWLIEALRETGKMSPLAFSAMINIFEASYYEGDDPISRLLRKSSKPVAANGYNLHYKINLDHRHCDIPLELATKMAPQTRDHALFTLSLFELTLHLLDSMEKDLVCSIKAC